MADDVSDIRTFYDRNVGREQGRLERHGIERDVTWRYLDRYLPPSGRILDIGAAAGAYTIPLAQRGYSVTAVDLSPALIQECGKRARNAKLGKKVTCLVADARDLSGVKDNDFDAVLLLGPLYHLVLEADRQTALKEAFGKLGRGGIVFSSFISRYGIWGDIMHKYPQHIEEHADDMKSILDKGTENQLPAWDARFRAYFATPAEIIPLHERLGFKTLALVGVEPVGVGTDEAYKNLTESQRRQWLDLMFTISTEISIIGASCHLLYIGEKAS